MTLVKVKNASFSYGDKEIFTNLNFEVDRGQILCLLGPNGCGKTTLMDCILGFNRLNSGSIYIKSKNINDMNPREIAKNISYVPQTHIKKFPYRVIDIVLMGRAAYTSMFSSPDKKDTELAEKALAMVGMLDYKDRLYTKLSGGESQLIMIARALAQKTSIIILDEPTAHLDFQHELRIMEKVVKLVKENGFTVIMATHFPNHAFYFHNNAINTSILMLNNKKIAASGTPGTVLSAENIRKVFKVSARVLEYYSKEKGEKANYIIPLCTLKESINSEECYLK